ncbi:YgfZ/GcvT domain-containing protein [Kineococcus glutinatus]|uniref:Folate-binding protein YgfZ n=1 Tax=Kineococcus glutinatus TaxID=1070872 RepID=A0ABP9I604_9ACTN
MTADTRAAASAGADAQEAPAPPRSVLLARPGAVEAEGADAGVAWHYGDPVAEQRALAAGRGFVDLSHRGVVTVTGPDRLGWLHSTTTQDLRALPPHRSTESLLLSPHGHVEHALHVVDDGETTWITVEPGRAPALAAWLHSMRFMLRVEVADVTGSWAVLGQPLRAGSAPGEPLAWCDPWPGEPPLAEGGTADTASYAAVRTDEHPGAERAWREVLVPRPGLEAHVGDAPLAGTWAAEALRIAAWRPRAGFETDHRTIPHEVDWLRTAVHLHKGCYRGQETVARVHNLGRPPRRLVFLHLDGSGHDLPERGDDVLLGEKRVGFVTSAARHHELGPIGLALLKRSTPADAPLVVVGGAGGDGVPGRRIAAAQELVVAP